MAKLMGPSLSLRIGAQQRLTQRLVLTPALQQAIKLLPMTTLELVDMLNQEVVENPLLEEIPAEELQSPEAPAQTEKQEIQVPERDSSDSWEDSDYEYFFGDYLDDGYRPSVPRDFRELPPIENTLPAQSSLADHLTWQLSLQTQNTDPLVREIGLAIIGNLDTDGYLVASVDEIAQMENWQTADVERALVVLQGFDPIGVAARDLQECLLLQSAHLGLKGTGTEAIIRDHLVLLQKHQAREIARQLDMSTDELKHHVEIIRQLDPKPGSRFNESSSQYVIPDVHVHKVEEQYVAALNDDSMPQLRISPLYRRLLDKKREGDDETRAYVNIVMRNYWMYQIQAKGAAECLTGMAQGLWPTFPTANGMKLVRLSKADGQGSIGGGTD